MTRIFIAITAFLYGLLFSTPVQAQEGLRLEFDVRFNDDFDRGRNDRMHKAILTVQGSRSRYFMVSQSAYRNSGDQDLVFSPDTSMLVYTDQSEGLMFAQEYDIEGNAFLLSDSLYPMQWEITGEEKKIGSYTCTRARCRFRGRDYIAWFTPDLPVACGPWKMGGLPGLILELQDKEENLVVKLASVNRSSEPIMLPSGVRYSMSEHIRETLRMIERLRTGARAQATGDCLTCTGNSTYTFRLWEKLPQ